MLKSVVGNSKQHQWDREVGLPCHHSFVGMDEGQRCSKDLGKGAAVPGFPQRQTAPRDKDLASLVAALMPGTSSRKGLQL